MTEGKLEVPADLYLYHGKDDELISLYNNLGRFVKKPVFIGLADIARKRELVALSDLFSAEGDKINVADAEIIRLKMYRKDNPELINLWEKLPRGTKSPVFAAMIKTALKSFNGKIPLVLLTVDKINSIPDDYIEIEEIEISGEVKNGLSREASSLASSLMSSSLKGIDFLEED